MPVVVDTSVLVAYYNLDDSLHARAEPLVARLAAGEWGTALVTDIILAETLTVLAARAGMAAARDVADAMLGGGVEVRSTMEVLPRAAALFLDQRSFRLSFADASLLALAEADGAPMMTFDADLAARAARRAA